MCTNFLINKMVLVPEGADKATIAIRNGETRTETSFDCKDKQDNLTMTESEPQNPTYPKSVFFIIGNEFCTRYASFGLHAILVLYLTQKLNFDDDTATIIFHAFVSMSAFMSVFGAIISDSWLGKFKTILYVSLVYALGSLIVTIGAIPILQLPATMTIVIGLVLVGLGNGGIKPCVSAFGGDQFTLPAQAAQMASFFSIYYFAINAGALTAIFVTPILRQDVHCFDESDCYSLAFGIPGILMIISIVIFFCGKPSYKINPPSGDMVTEITKCIKNAIATKISERKTEPREHWLDYSEEKFGKQLVADVKVLLRILVLYIPLPLFWALFDQQGSRWTFQATRMDGDIGYYVIKPDQMSAVNTMLVLVFIPIFQTLIYPMLARIGIRRPLQKITIGMFMIALSFVVSGIVELELEKTYPVLPSEGQAQLRFINGLPCDFTASTNIGSNENFTLDKFAVFEQKYINIKSANHWHEFTLESIDPKCPKQIKGYMRLYSAKATTVFVSGPALKPNDTYIDDPRKFTTPKLRVLFSSLGNETFHEVKIVTPNHNNHVAFIANTTHQELFAISSGVHEVQIDGENYKTITLKEGSVSTLIVHETPGEQTKYHVRLVEITQPNSMSMLWLLPQYILLTIAEVMFSITGYEFSYAQAPNSMKTVLQACWMLSFFFGNVIIILIAVIGPRSHSQADEFFLYAGLMVLGTLVFMVLAKNYKCEPARSSETELDCATNKNTVLSAASTKTLDTIVSGY